MSNTVLSPANPEAKIGIYPLGCPVGYFDAQIQFAHKWSEITGEDFGEVVATKTALSHQLGGNEELADALQGVEEADPATVTQQLYETYSALPHSIYEDSSADTPYGYDYYPDTQTVKVHFTNHRRGEKPLSDENLPQRREDMKALLEKVRQEHPEAALFMSATWLRSTSRYRNLSPPDIAEQKNLMSPDMKLTGNSVWGQFIDASGHTNERVYSQFLDGVKDATSIDELLAAFPYPTLKAVDPIEKYYEFYGAEPQKTQ
jgi:hypothetical protein